MTQPDQQAFNTDTSPNAPTPKRNSPFGFFLDFLNRTPRPLLYGIVAAGLFGGIAAWYLVYGNQTAEPVVDTAPLTQTPTNPVAQNPITTPPTTTPNTVDPGSNLSRALEVQDIPFLVTTEGSGNTGKTAATSEIATPGGNRNQTSAGLNPFAPIPTPPVQTLPSEAPIQQPNPNIVASNPNQSNLSNSVRIPPSLRPTPNASAQVNTSKPNIVVKQPTPLPTPKTPVQKPPTLSNNKPKTPQGGSSGTTQTSQKPSNSNTKPVQKPNVVVQPTPQPPTTPSEPIVITSRPDIRVPNSTTNPSLPIAAGGGVLPIAPQIIQKVNPPQVPQIPVVQPQTQPTKPLELPNEGGVITPDTTSTSSGLKPSGTNNTSGQVDPLNTTITPVKPQPPVVVAPVTPPPVVVPPVEPPRSILNEFITERQLRYLDYVGGPFPQARLEIKGKSVIVGLGETIPDSKVVVKSITASELVLLLGEETLTIPRTDK
jgi:hypothetical protein